MISYMIFNPFSRFKRKRYDAGKIPAACTICGRIMPSDQIAEHLNEYHSTFSFSKQDHQRK